jgi:hypothetical protein
MGTTKEQIKAVLGVIRAVADAIKELGEVPSGHLYASLMGQLSLSEYEQVIDILVRGGLVHRGAGYLLIWVGPAKGEMTGVELKDGGR